MPLGCMLTLCFGTLVRKPILRKNDNGGSYCYFTLAVHSIKKGAPGEKGTIETEFHDCSASSWAAERVCTCDKGDMLVFLAVPRSKSREVMKDGEKHIYHDKIWDIPNSRTPLGIQVIPRRKDTEAEGADAMAEGPASVPNDGNCAGYAMAVAAAAAGLVAGDNACAAPPLGGNAPAPTEAPGVVPAGYVLPQQVAPVYQTPQPAAAYSAGSIQTQAAAYNAQPAETLPDGFLSPAEMAIVGKLPF